MLVQQIKDEVLKVTKKKKFRRKHSLFPNDYYAGFDISSYIRRSTYQRNRHGKGSHRKPYDFGPEKYKLEIVLDVDFAICIDAKKVLIYGFPDNAGWDYINVPIYKSENISKEDFFHLSTEHKFILTPDEITELRAIMNEVAQNKYVTIYKTPCVIGGLVPFKW